MPIYASFFKSPSPPFHHLAGFYPMESPRVSGMENRLKLLGIVTLVYAFLLDLIFSDHWELVDKVLQLKCH
jgi:hypothetical protein